MEGTEGKDCISRNVDVIKHVCLMPASPIPTILRQTRLGIHDFWPFINVEKTSAETWNALTDWETFPEDIMIDIMHTDSAGKEVFNIH